MGFSPGRWLLGRINHTISVGDREPLPLYKATFARTLVLLVSLPSGSSLRSWSSPQRDLIPVFLLNCSQANRKVNAPKGRTLALVPVLKNWPKGKFHLQVEYIFYSNGAFTTHWFGAFFLNSGAFSPLFRFVWTDVNNISALRSTLNKAPWFAQKRWSHRGAVRCRREHSTDQTQGWKLLLIVWL